MSNMTAVSPISRGHSPALAAALGGRPDRSGDARRCLVFPAGAWSSALSALPRAALRLLSRGPAGGRNRARRRAWRPRVRLLIGGLVILALAALGNAVLGGYHAGVEWKFWPVLRTAPVRSAISAARARF